MPKYCITQYELYTRDYFVEADSQAEAIQALFEDDGTIEREAPEFEETADVYGMPRDENQALADALEDLDISCEHIIPSIKSISEYED